MTTDVADLNGLPDATHRARRDRFVDQIAEFAIHAARQEAVDAAVTPGTTAAVADDGFPILWAVAWRARSASWILKNRQLLAAALTR